MIFVLSMIDSLLALYTKLKGGKCLIYIGREGFFQEKDAMRKRQGRREEVCYVNIWNDCLQKI